MPSFSSRECPGSFFLLVLWLYSLLCIFQGLHPALEGWRPEPCRTTQPGLWGCTGMIGSGDQFVSLSLLLQFFSEPVLGCRTDWISLAAITNIICNLQVFCSSISGPLEGITLTF